MVFWKWNSIICVYLRKNTQPRDYEACFATVETALHSTYAQYLIIAFLIKVVFVILILA